MAPSKGPKAKRRFWSLPTNYCEPLSPPVRSLDNHNAKEVRRKMLNIKVGRYDTTREPKGHHWAGWIEPEDRSWIVFVGEDHTTLAVFLDRSPETGAVL
jgi:hypothetical protein